MLSKFKIGDKVKTNWFGTGTVTDVLYSPTNVAYTYDVSSEDDSESCMFKEDELELDGATVRKEYHVGIEVDPEQNLVVATLYEDTNGETTAVVEKSYGRLIHEGGFGIAQAASFACMKLYKKLGGFRK